MKIPIGNQYTRLNILISIVKYLPVGERNYLEKGDGT